MFRFAAALSAAVILSTAANAACTQANLSGKWQAYTSSWETKSKISYWSRCTFTVNAAGTMSAASCVNSLGQSGPMTGGKVKISKEATCTYTAQFVVGGALNKVGHGTLAKDKYTASGVGTFPGGGFLFTMTKL
jgi:hypothetical protein